MLAVLAKSKQKLQSIHSGRSALHGVMDQTNEAKAAGGAALHVASGSENEEKITGGAALHVSMMVA